MIIFLCVSNFKLSHTLWKPSAPILLLICQPQIGSGKIDRSRSKWDRCELWRCDLKYERVGSEASKSVLRLVKFSRSVYFVLTIKVSFCIFKSEINMCFNNHFWILNQSLNHKTDYLHLINTKNGKYFNSYTCNLHLSPLYFCT